VSRTIVLLLALVAAIPGCVRPDPTPRFTPAWEGYDPTAGNPLKTRKALLVADCQINNLFCRPLPERNLSAEAAAETAIRPPQLDMFSADVMRWILKNGSPDADVVLHLGDALNLATTGEFDRFLEIMETSTRPWFMAPGNHDFFYLGIYAPQDEQMLADAAYASGEPLVKDQFIRLYVAALLRQTEEGCLALADALGIEPGKGKSVRDVAKEIPATFEWHAGVEFEGYLAGICWKLDPERPWRSYLLQSINVSDPASAPWEMRVYLLDSCQYQYRPTMAPNAWRSYPSPLNVGLTGEMLPDQLRKIREWLESAAELHGTVAMCHHPFEHLAPRSRTNLGWLWREQQMGALVSAHTHSGYFAHHDLGGERDEIELNIGSTTDWPMEWRTLQTFVDTEKRTIYVRSDRSMLVDVLRKRGGFFEPGWEIPLNAPDDYRHYKQGESAKGLLVDYYLGAHLTPYWLPPPRIKPNKAARDTEMDVKRAMLWTHLRLVSRYPTDPASEPDWPSGCFDDESVVKRIQTATGTDEPIENKIAFLQELARFEKSRSTVDPATGESVDDVRLRYKISQATWASRFMAEKGRRLRVEDDLIRVDWDERVEAKAREYGVMKE
jgi:hypothetical protein